MIRASGRSVALALLLLSSPVLARDVAGTDPPFRARIPDAFAPMTGTQRDVYVFVAPGRAADVPRVITLRPLDGTLAQGEFDERALQDMVRSVAPGASVRVVPGTALGVDVPLVLGESAGHDSMAVAQIPSVPRAIQLVVSGPANAGGEVERIARDVMASMQARSNWLTHGEIVRRRIARGLVVAAWILLALYGVAWAALFRRTPRPTTQRIALVTIGLAFGITAALLASVRRGASAFEPITPALVAIVLIANALQIRAEVRSDRGG